MSKMRANRKQKINEKGKEKVKFILSKGINKVQRKRDAYIK